MPSDGPIRPQDGRGGRFAVASRNIGYGRPTGQTGRSGGRLVEMVGRPGRPVLVAGAHVTRVRT